MYFYARLLSSIKAIALAYALNDVVIGKKRYSLSMAQF